MVNFEDVKVGDFVTVSCWGGGVMDVIVEDTYDNIKNGRPGIDHDKGWSYADQIVEHEPYVAAECEGTW